MIRHSKSLFASILLHSLIIILVLVIYRNWPENKKEEEKLVCLQMSHILEKKEEPKVVEPIPLPKKIEKPKVIKKQKKVKPKPKKKVKPKPKPKVKKKIPVIAKEPEKVVEEVKEIEPVKALIVEETPPEPVEVIEEVPVESASQKAKRLEEEYLDKHIKRITMLLRDNLYYPRSARKRGVTGTVLVKFKLLKNGSVSFSKVTSSKSEILSRAALKTIDDLSGDFPHPSEDLILHVPINYSLNR